MLHFKKKVFFKLFSTWTIIFAMVLGIYGYPIVAGLTTDETLADQSADVIFLSETDPYLEQAINTGKPVKVEEECDEYTTIFQNPDGSRSSYMFQTPVRYKDSAGKWQEIDSQLVEVSSDKLGEGYQYQNKTNIFSVYFPENMASDVPVLLEDQDYSIEIKPIQLKDTSKDDKSKYDAVAESATLDNIKNEVKFEKEADKAKAIIDGEVQEVTKSVKYSSGFDDTVELVYSATDTGLKEEIIISEYTGLNEFQFLLQLEGVEPELHHDGSILLKYTCTDEIAGSFPEMYMYDAYTGEEKLEGEHFSEAVTYSIADGKKDGEYILTVTADTAFLEDESTVYP